MSTRYSSLSVLKRQAGEMAAMIKAAGRGEKVAAQFAERVEAARKTNVLKTGIVMNDKVITIEMTWETIRSTSEAGIAEYILRQMREARDTVQ